jgi:hypothetical protein
MLDLMVHWPKSGPVAADTQASVWLPISYARILKSNAKQLGTELMLE